VVHSVRARTPGRHLAGRRGTDGDHLRRLQRASFLKYNLNISSMLMSVGFAVAVVCYVVILGLSA